MNKARVSQPLAIMKRSTSDAADTSGMGPPGAKVSRTQGPDEAIDTEFVGLKGQLLVEAIFNKYGAGTMTIPWLNEETKERNIRRDSTNRPIMESLAEAYADRILSSGLNVDCSGGGF